MPAWLDNMLPVNGDDDPEPEDRKARIGFSRKETDRNTISILFYQVIRGEQIMQCGIDPI
jgi:hypothetical protein